MYGTSTGDHDRGKCKTLSWLITVIAEVFAEHRECDGLLMRLLFFFYSNGHEHIFVLYTACLLISRAAVCAHGVETEKQQTVFFVRRRRLTTVVTLFILWIFILPSLMHCLSFSSVGYCHFFCWRSLFCSPYLPEVPCCHLF